MTLVIDVSPELESRLEEEAAKQGVGVVEFVRGVLERQVMPPEAREASSMVPEERVARVRALRGKYAHVRFSSEDLIREKQEEIDLEEQRWAKHWNNRSR